MDDDQIIALYFDRDERAIAEEIEAKDVGELIDRFLQRLRPDPAIPQSSRWRRSSCGATAPKRARTPGVIFGVIT